jgi:uncharacterized membrane protein YkoI
MLTQVGPHEYEVTHLVLDEAQSLQLELLMQQRNEAAVRSLEEASERAQKRVSGRSLRELLAS